MTEEAKAMIERARERGYSLNMHSSDKSWYSFSHERYPLNLQLFVNTGDFSLTHLKGIVKITTDKCGSFMMDSHFNRIEREMRTILFDLL